jgi:catechol 2,3-dioxygenase-like lactoylglutathione lyase family enzyme
MPILSLHHVTATVNDAQDDLDFCRDGLGLRLVKRTVNFDNHHVHHFYYGDERGTPGTIWTTFPYKDRGVKVGTKGAGQVTVTAFSVPDGSLPRWKARLLARGLAVRDIEPRFGEEALRFSDRSGLDFELIATSRRPRAVERRRHPGVGRDPRPSQRVDCGARAGEDAGVDDPFARIRRCRRSGGTHSNGCPRRCSRAGD